MARVLTRAGHAVDVARSGKEALALAQSACPTLVLTDIIMTDMDGIEVMLALRKRWPTVPVVAISGGGRVHASEFLDLARHLGANATLRKPFTSDELLAVVDQTLVAGVHRAA